MTDVFDEPLRSTCCDPRWLAVLDALDELDAALAAADAANETLIAHARELVTA